MNAQQFFETVREMRKMQKAYFKNRLQSDLIKCKELERKVDQAVVDAIELPMEEQPAEEQQMGLFPGESK